MFFAPRFARWFKPTAPVIAALAAACGSGLDDASTSGPEYLERFPDPEIYSYAEGDKPSDGAPEGAEGKTPAEGQEGNAPPAGSDGGSASADGGEGTEGQPAPEGGEGSGQPEGNEGSPPEGEEGAPEPEPSAQASIGPGGGRLKTEDGMFEIIIPEGALEAKVSVSVGESNRTFRGLTGKVYRARAKDAVLKKPATVRIRFTNANILKNAHPAVWDIVDERGQSTGLETTTTAEDGPQNSDTVAEAQTSAFSNFGVVSTVDRRFTFRAITGVSMGSGGAAMYGMRNRDKVDMIGALGGVNSVTYLLRLIRTMHLGGFCEMDEIIENPGKDCGDVKGTDVSIESDPPMYEHDQRFNNWYYSDNGGNFDRREYISLFQDLAYAWGNPGYWNDNSPRAAFGNPDYYDDGSPFLPAGDLKKWKAWLDMPESERCDNPLVFMGVHNKEYNPDGSFPAITFCDGWDHGTGVYNPDKKPDTSLPVGLAIDYNGNSLRDYGEPVISNGFERFKDTGCSPDDEYHYRDNPMGTRNNWLWDECEDDFDDFGLDGVDGTGDYGEGNGVFDYSPNIKYFMQHDPDAISGAQVHPGLDIAHATKEELKRMYIYADAGIRDLFNFANGANHWAGAVNTQVPMTIYNDFKALLPPDKADKKFAYDYVDWDILPRNLYVRYGNPKATPTEIEDGDGAHVGTATQLIDRLLTFLSYVNNRFPNGDFNRVGAITKLDIRQEALPSKVLNADWNYSLVLPADYREDHPNGYPVVYFLHGYGQKPEDLQAVAAITYGGMQGGTWQKFIMVFLDGRCCFLNPKGERFCDEPPPNTNGPWTRECVQGSFYVNHRDLFGPGPQFEDAITEVMDYIDSRYNTRKRQTLAVPADEVDAAE